MMMVLRIKKQFAVRRWNEIGPRPISQEAEDLIVKFLLIGHGPEQIAVVSSQHPMPAGHDWILFQGCVKTYSMDGRSSKHLRHRGKRRRSNSVSYFARLPYPPPSLPKRVTISQRPQSANQQPCWRLGK